MYKATANASKNEASFANIELVTEKSAEYWIEGAKEVKKEYPDHHIVASIMCGYNKKDW
jgi:dihydropyrimidine dehydrogenase (NADP+)